MKRQLRHCFQFTLAAGVCGVSIAISACGKTDKPTSSNGAAAKGGLQSKVDVAAARFTAPEHEHGLYLTAWSASSARKRDHIYQTCAAAGFNTLVIDVRDLGQMFWDTGIPLAEQAHANMHAIRDPKPLMDELAAHKLYPIARIACFSDNFVPRAFPERGIQTLGGKTWQDPARHSWLDPYNQKNWEYIGKVVDYALDAGFPEIQLDYVRFPDQGKASSKIFPAKNSYPDKDAKHEDVIVAFVNFIGKRVRARGAVFSADIFGLVSEVKNDLGIGQQLEKIAKPFDMICPMVYPSHFRNGEYGIKEPNKSPFDIVYKSLRDYKARVPDTRVRPWLQAFSLYGVKYTDKEVLDQIRAAREFGYQDFLLWNAANRYDFDASFGAAVDKIESDPPAPVPDYLQKPKPNAASAPPTAPRAGKS